MTRHRDPRGRGRLFAVAGGQVPGPEDFQAGGPLEPTAAEDPPVLQGVTFAEAADTVADLINTAAVAAAIEWDQRTAAEPFQVDLTRGMEDTVRIGNSLSAAVRLELLADSWREEVADRPGPGWPADEEAAPFTDPVSGDQLDPVDGLPYPADEEWATVADLHAQAAPLRYASPRPINGDAVGAPVEDGANGWTTPEPVNDYGATPAPRTAGRVLNWTSRHDPKSVEFGVRARLRAPAPLVDRVWEHGPIMDQGSSPPLSLHDASGCTGHAGINAANVLELATVPAYTRPGDVDLYGHEDAMRLYDRAQHLDDVPGEAYPGTSILALMKAGQEFGLWGSYLWAFGTKDLAQAILQVGPVVVGIPWLAGMTDPGPDGIITVSGEQVGGHALCLHAIRMNVAGRAGPWFGALQTWGEGVGDHGVIWFHHKSMAQLLHGVGEAAIPLAHSDAALP